MGVQAVKIGVQKLKVKQTRIGNKTGILSIEMCLNVPRPTCLVDVKCCVICYSHFHFKTPWGVYQMDKMF